MSKAIRVHLPEGDCQLITAFISPSVTSDYFNRLQRDIAWQQPVIQMFGKKIRSPRLHAWYGDREAVYTWSGVHYDPQPWTCLLSDIRDQIEDRLDVQFNSVLLNYYRDNNDSIGLHSDDEAELGHRPVIASLSLGATRRFRFKSRTGHAGSVSMPLESGALLIMQGATQQFWLHGIGKSKKPATGRINLTFRRVQLK